MQIPMREIGNSIFRKDQPIDTVLRFPYNLVGSWTTGSPYNRGWPLKGLSRVMENCHARFLGGLGPAMAPGYPVYQALKISVIPKYHITSQA